MIYHTSEKGGLGHDIFAERLSPATPLFAEAARVTDSHVQYLYNTTAARPSSDCSGRLLPSRRVIITLAYHSGLRAPLPIT